MGKVRVEDRPRAERFGQNRGQARGENHIGATSGVHPSRTERTDTRHEPVDGGDDAVRRCDDKRADHRGELQATNAAERLARQAPWPFDARTHPRSSADGVDDRLDRVDLVTGAATRLRVATRQQGQEARRRDVVPDANLADADYTRSAGRGRGDAIPSNEQSRVEARTVAVTLVLVSM